MSLLQRIGRKALFLLDPETAHGVSIRALKSGLVPPCSTSVDNRLEVSVAGLKFPNPIGLSAGYDKNAEVPDAMLALGFGFVEVGSITPRAQAGNPKPRVFRLEGQDAVINRLGFNNEGHERALQRLKARSGRPGIIGVNIGANKDSADMIADYEFGIGKFFDVASYFTVNISSPNTPGLRDLQSGAALSELIDRVQAKRDATALLNRGKRPVFLKIAPDLNQKQMEEIARVVTSSALDGLVISNTTIGRHGVEGLSHADESGGLSGKPLFERSTIVLARMRVLVGKSLPIIGVGGINNAATAIAKLEAGADLLQLYTGMIYAGPCLAARINSDILQELKARGLDHVWRLTGQKTQHWAQKNLHGE